MNQSAIGVHNYYFASLSNERGDLLPHLLCCERAKVLCSGMSSYSIHNTWSTQARGYVDSAPRRNATLNLGTVTTFLEHYSVLLPV